MQQGDGVAHLVTLGFPVQAASILEDASLPRDERPTIRPRIGVPQPSAQGPVRPHDIPGGQQIWQGWPDGLHGLWLGGPIDGVDRPPRLPAGLDGEPEDWFVVTGRLVEGQFRGYLPDAAGGWAWRDLSVVELADWVRASPGYRPEQRVLLLLEGAAVPHGAAAPVAWQLRHELGNPSVTNPRGALAYDADTGEISVNVPDPGEDDVWVEFSADSHPTYSAPAPEQRTGLTAPQQLARAAMIWRLGSVLGMVAHAPQALGGLEELRRQIVAQFPDAGWRFRDTLTGQLSESQILGQFDSTRGGLAPPQLRLGGADGDRQMGYVLTSGLRWIEQVAGPAGCAVAAARSGRVGAGRRP